MHMSIQSSAGPLTRAARPANTPGMRRPSIASACAALSLACGPTAPGETTDATTSADTTGAAASTASLTDDPTAAASSGEATTASSTTVPSDPAVCAAAASLEIKAVTATPSAGPTWNPGEALTIEATLRNPTADDFLTYPGIRVSTEAPGVTSDAPENWLFALLAGMEAPLQVGFAAGDAAVPGPVQFEVEIVVLNETCPGLARRSLEVQLEP